MQSSLRGFGSIPPFNSHFS